MNIEGKLLNLRLQAERRTVLPDHDLMLWAHDEIERMDKLLARAADALNRGSRMSEMDLGSEITEFRRANQQPAPSEG